MKPIDLAKQLNRAIQLFLQKGTLSDSEKMEVPDMYPQWKDKHSYSIGDIVKYGMNEQGETQLYTVLQAHTSQDTWQPNTSPALFKAIGFTDSGIPLWVQPLGASDAYQKDDTVSHKNNIYISTINGNVWEPGVYGWAMQHKEG